MFRILLVLLCVVASVTAQIRLKSHSQNETQVLAYGEKRNSTAVSVQFTRPAAYFAFQTSTAEGSAEEFSSTFKSQSITPGFDIAIANDGLEVRSVSTCSVETQPEEQLYLSYTSDKGVNVTDLKIKYDIVTHLEESSIELDQEYWISPVTWASGFPFYSKPNYIPSFSLQKFYSVHVPGNSSYDGVHLQLDITNKANEVHVWSEYFISMAAGSYDFTCALRGNSVKLDHNKPDKILTKIIKNIPVPVNGTTIDISLLLSKHESWYSSKFESAFSFKVTTTPADIVPEAPATGFQLELWQIIVISIIGFIILLLIAGTIWWNCRGGQYETIE